MTDLDRITIVAPLKMIILGHEQQNNFALQEVYVEPKSGTKENKRSKLCFRVNYLEVVQSLH